jgi:hypothetical protein
MNAFEALTKIRLMLGLEAEAEVKSIELAEITLVDGTVVKVDGELAEGKALVVVTEEGEIPAPEGIHESSDGKLITVDAEGMIVAVEDKPVEEVEQEMEAVSEQPKSNSEEVSFSENFLAQVAGLISPISERLDAIEAKFSGLTSEFQEFSAQPAADKITNNLYVGTSDIKSHSARQEQRMNTLLEMRKLK